MDSFVYILVFVAVVFIGFYAISTTFRYLIERQETSTSNEYDSFKGFIEKTTLLKMRISAATLCAGLLFSLLVAASGKNVAAYAFVSIAVGGVGYMLPYWYFQRKVSERAEQFKSSIPDFSLGLAGGMKAGQSLTQAMQSVAKRLCGPISAELNTTLREHRLGLDITEALERLYNRMPCEDLHLLVTSIKLTIKSGGSLVEVLEKITETIRQRTEFYEKLKTMTAQGRFEALSISLSPIAAFFLLYIVDKELMAPVLTTTTGWIAIGIVIALVSMGYYIINKIVSIDV